MRTAISTSLKWQGRVLMQKSGLMEESEAEFREQKKAEKKRAERKDESG